MTEFVTPEVRGKMAALRAEIATTADRVRKDPRYSTEGRRNAIAAAYTAGAKQAGALRTQFNQQMTEQRSTLESQLFGRADTSRDPSAVLSWRDAQDRAARIDNGTAAARAYHNARINGDTHLMTALVQHAAAHSWMDVLHEADNAEPGTLDKLKALENMPSERGQKQLSNVGFVLPAPTELQGANPDTIATWAASAVAPASDEISYVHM